MTSSSRGLQDMYQQQHAPRKQSGQGLTMDLPRERVRKKRVPQALQRMGLHLGPLRHCGDSAVACRHISDSRFRYARFELMSQLHPNKVLSHVDKTT